MSDETPGNGAVDTSNKKAEPEQPAKLARFWRYFGRPVVLQLKTAIVQFDFGGEGEVGGKRVGLCVPALTENEDGKAVAIGRVLYLSNVVLEPASDGEHLTVLAPLRSGAIIEMNIPPEQVEYVTCIARLPSPIVQGSTIVAPGN